MKVPKRYIGDGVYVEFDSGNMILTTENGIDVTNEIHIDDEVFHGLIKAIEQALDCKIKITANEEASDENG